MRGRKGFKTHEPGECSVQLTLEIALRYVKELKKEFSTKKASEISYRMPLKRMIEAMTDKKILAQVETKGKSDVQLFLKGRAAQPHSKQLGTIETKTIEAGHRISKLTELITKNSAQLKKYLQNEPTIMFTNYVEFAILELNSQTNEIDCAKIVELVPAEKFTKKKIHSSDIEHQKLEKLFSDFILKTNTMKPITTQKMLACRLACCAKDISENVIGRITELKKIKQKDIKNVNEPIYVFYKPYTDLTNAEDPKEIANAFGQTISCGLFLAMLNGDSNHPNFRLTRNIAAANIPSEVPVIKSMFQGIENCELPKSLANAITQIIDILNQTDINKIKNESSDVFLYFYEEFLKAFDKKTRARMGVYYTPIEVVNYICEKVNTLLKNEFGRSFGFGDASIRTLDPATGTGTFLVRAIELAINENNSGAGGGGGARDNQEKLLIENFIGFEILVPPYIIAHMKIISLLNKSKQAKHNVNIYLTNTLGSSEDIGTEMLGPLAQEIKQTSKIKNKTPIMVVIGNPPWSAINKAKLDDRFIKKKMESYKRKKVLGTHSLADPYVKFIRFAQHKIVENGSGIVGMIVNNSFLDGIGFEGMRIDLTKAFDKIIIYNLHGNEKIDKNDKNIFDITTSNTIIVMIKFPEELRTKNANCVIEYDEIKGTRNEKFNALKNKTNNWKKIYPENTNHFLFIPHTADKVYEKWMRLDQIFSERFTGSNTHRDDFVVAFDKETIESRIIDFLDSNISDRDLIAKYALKSSLDKIKKIRANARHEGLKKDLIRDYSYRPFDCRTAYFSKYVMGARRAQYNDVRNVLSICVPSSSGSDPWSAVHITKGMADIKFCEFTIPSYMFPLKLKPQTSYETKIDDDEHDASLLKHDYNYTEKFIQCIMRKYKNGITGEDVFYYIYGILHSPLYRKKYTQHLKHEFPRIPFINNTNNEYGDSELLLKISALGKELVNYHRMAKTVQIPNSKIAWSKTNTTIKTSRVTRNGNMITVRFLDYEITSIPCSIWDYNIGGRNVLSHVIDRFISKADLNLADRQHFLNVCGSISKTFEIQDSLDMLLDDRLFKKRNSGAPQI